VTRPMLCFAPSSSPPNLNGLCQETASRYGGELNGQLCTADAVALHIPPAEMAAARENATAWLCTKRSRVPQRTYIVPFSAPLSAEILTFPGKSQYSVRRLEKSRQVP
jgi:hypothetical protein